MNVKDSVYVLMLNKYCLNGSLSAYYNLQLYRGQSVVISTMKCSRPLRKLRLGLTQGGLSGWLLL